MTLAPGYILVPFKTSFRIASMLKSVTRSGYVNVIAISIGTATSSISKFGSGDITVRAEKLTRFPDRCLRNRPSLPFRRWHRPLYGF